MCEELVAVKHFTSMYIPCNVPRYMIWDEFDPATEIGRNARPMCEYLTCISAMLDKTRNLFVSSLWSYTHCPITA